MPMHDPNVTCLADLIGIAVRRNPNAVAIEFNGGSRTYGQFWDRANRCAHAMLAFGLGAGDRVVLFANNSPEYLEIYMGLQLAGMVAVPANYRLTGEELVYLVNNSRASALVIGEEFLPLLTALQSRIPFEPDKVVVIGGDHARAYQRLIGAASSAAMKSRAQLAMPGAIFYTSGTTGFPKGAMMSHLTMLTRFSSWGWRFGITEDEVTLVPGPIFHQSFGSVAIVSLCVGAKVILRSEFRGEEILSDIDLHGVTWCFLVPKMIATLHETAAAGARVGECSALRGIMSSGARLPTPLIDGFERMFPKARLSDAYGWTESGWLTYCRHEDLIRTNRSLGRSSFGCEVAILDDEGKRLPPGEAGQIYAINPVPFMGYFNNPQATAAMRVGKWETGGDVGVMDEEGFLHILDRKRDTIISGGENIYPAEIERVLVEHPKVLEVAVVGVQDQKWGESPRACLVLREGEKITDDEVFGFCVGKLAKFKHPKSVVVLESLPRNSMGKVLRRELREQFWTQ